VGAEGEGGAVRVDDAVRQIRATASDQFEGQGSDGLHVFAHPRRDVGFVNSDEGTVHNRED